MNKWKENWFELFLIAVIAVLFIAGLVVNPPEESLLQPIPITEEDAITVPPEDTVSLISQYSEDECYLAPDQLEAVRFSYWYGKPFDVGYTLAAIAIQESNAGRWSVNLQDPSAGYYHVTLDKVLLSMDWEPSEFNLNRAASLLVIDRDYSASLAVRELLMWREQSPSDWYEVWASYHKGWKGSSNYNGKVYANKIRAIIHKMKLCNWVGGL